MLIKLIMLDLDGTLLDSQKRLPEANRAALQAAASKGITVVPASGRVYGGMPAAVRDLPFVRYAVGANGAQVYDAWEKKVIRRAEIPLELADRVYDYLDSLPVIYDCYVDGDGFIDSRHYAQIDEFITDRAVNAMARSIRRPVEDFRDYIHRLGKPLQKIQMFFRDMDRRAREMEKLAEMFPALTVISSIANNIEMNDRAATKGEALRFLCCHLGIGPDQAMAFGDMSNDLSMIEAAGLGIAMQNADSDLAAAADYVTDTNDHCGVAMALKKFVL